MQSDSASKPQSTSIESYIAHHRKAGTSDQEITNQLLRAGWSQAQIDAVLSPDVPPPPAPVTNNMSSQTSNAGTPLQVEGVQYNMRMKAVESKVGLYIKIAGGGLWFTVIFVCGFLSAIIQRLANHSGNLGGALVLTISLSIVTTPIFFIAYKKFLAEQAKNPATSDDIFFKKHIRRNLWWAIIWGALFSVVTIYEFLSKLFLQTTASNYANAFSFLMFALGFGSIIYFYWRLHAKTQR